VDRCQPGQGQGLAGGNRRSLSADRLDEGAPGDRGPFVVRHAVVADADAIARVHTSAWQQAYRGILSSEFLSSIDWRERAVRWTERLERDLAGPSVTRVAVDRLGVVRGFLKAGPSRDEDVPAGMGEVYAVYVDPTVWGVGVGSDLMRVAMGDLDAATTSVTLWVLADNDQGRRFYERWGFVPDGCIKEDSIGDREVTEVRLIRVPG
jgi:ribosomal protein S18 acetylase RimI-like enzyme